MQQVYKHPPGWDSGEVLFWWLSRPVSIIITEQTTKTQVVYLETTGVPRRARGRTMVTQLANGVLKFSRIWRGKRTPRDEGAATFILLVNDIFSDISPYAPSTRNSV